MGTALVMEHANAMAQMIVSEKDKLFDERVEALVKLYRRAEFYLKQGFLESIVCEFHRKKVEMIMQAETKGEITEILKLSKPHFDGKKFVYTSPYAVEEEELLLWSLTSLQGPLRDEGFKDSGNYLRSACRNWWKSFQHRTMTEQKKKDTKHF